MALGGVIAFVVGFLFNNGGSVVIALIGLAIAVAGGWWIITERMPRRAIGGAGVVVGVAALVWGFTRAVSGSDRVIVRLVVVVGLLALGIDVRARRHGPRPSPHPGQRRGPDHARRIRSCSATRGPVAARWSGSAWSTAARELGVETVLLAKGLDLEKLARDAVARGADCLGMAGGDGSQALVASIAVEHGLPFVCVSAGRGTTSRSISGSTEKTHERR